MIRGGFFINIKDSPQYHLYYWTKVLNNNINKLIKGNISSRSVYATIINRAYYSAYSYTLFWLEENYSFRFKSNNYYSAIGEKPVSKHKQVRKELKFKNSSSSFLLQKLFNLRIIADYKLNEDLTRDDVNDAIEMMDDVVKSLNF